VTDRQFIFPITTGRSGSSYMAKMLRLNMADGAEVHHERTGYRALGVNTPDASHFTRFNSIGVDQRVTAFWAQRNRRFLKGRAPVYAEMSHFV
jgi:hypothetical protein